MLCNICNNSIQTLLLFEWLQPANKVYNFVHTFLLESNVEDSSNKAVFLTRQLEKCSGQDFLPVYPRLNALELSSVKATMYGSLESPEVIM